MIRRSPFLCDAPLPTFIRISDGGGDGDGDGSDDDDDDDGWMDGWQVVSTC